MASTSHDHKKVKIIDIRNFNQTHNDNKANELDDFLESNQKKEIYDEEESSDNHSVSDDSDRSLLEEESISDNESAKITGGNRVTEMLSADPLFLVLSEYLIDKKNGDNIVSVLNKINNNLSKLLQFLKD